MKNLSKNVYGKMISIIIVIIVVMVVLIMPKIENKETKVSGTNIKNYASDSRETMRLETDTAGVQVPVPIGYVGSKATGENTVNTGYVIYEGEEEVNDANVVDARKMRNQYVWIPVPDVNKLYGTMANGRIRAKLYDFTTSTSIEGVDKTTGARPLFWEENNGVLEPIRSISGGNWAYVGCTEPDIVPDPYNGQAHDTDSRLETIDIGAKNAHEWLIELESNFNEMIKSVGKYGGFYIGRYETGDLNLSEATVRKGKVQIGSQNWYTMYYKTKNLKGNNENVETSMIWGCLFDRTLSWLIESGNKTKKQICEDPVSWGNYLNNSITYINSSGVETTTTVGSRTRIPAGSSEYTKANNIYDLAGNNVEWTLEIYGSSDRTCRGGYCFANSTENEASIREGMSPYVRYDTLGCRAMLYIK